MDTYMSRPVSSVRSEPAYELERPVIETHHVHFFFLNYIFYMTLKINNYHFSPLIYHFPFNRQARMAKWLNISLPLKTYEFDSPRNAYKNL